MTPSILTDFARNVSMGSSITGGTEKLFRRSMFDQLPKIKEDHIVVIGDFLYENAAESPALWAGASRVKK